MPQSRWIDFWDHLQHVLKAAWLIACKRIVMDEKENLDKVTALVHCRRFVKETCLRKNIIVHTFK